MIDKNSAGALAAAYLTAARMVPEHLIAYESVLIERSTEWTQALAMFGWAEEQGHHPVAIIPVSLASAGMQVVTEIGVGTLRRITGGGLTISVWVDSDVVAGRETWLNFIDKYSPLVVVG